MIDEVGEYWRDNHDMSIIADAYGNKPLSAKLLELKLKKRKSICIWCKQFTPLIPNDAILVIDFLNHIHIKKCFPELITYLIKTKKIEELEV